VVSTAGAGLPVVWSWLAARQVVAAGVVLAVAALAIALGGLKFMHTERQTQQAVRNELLSRVLSDQAERSLDTVALALVSLADRVDQGGDLDGETLRLALHNTLANVPFVRDVVIATDSGQALVSARGPITRGNLNLAALGPVPGTGRTALGSFFFGRELPITGDVPRSKGPGTLPLMRLSGRVVGGHRLLVIALVNAEAFSTFQQSTIDDAGSDAALTSFKGEVVAATLGSRLVPGQTEAQLWPLHHALPDLDSATWQGEGLQGQHDIGAFRALRHHPLLVVVSTSKEVTLVRFWPRAQVFMGMALLTALVIVALSVLTQRSLRARAHARGQLDVAQHLVAEREHELNLIVSSVRDLLFRTDTRGRLTFINARWQALSNVPSSALLGQSLGQAFTPGSRAAVGKLFAAAASMGMAQVRAAIRGPDDVERTVDLSVVPLRDGEHLLGFAGSAVDVTPLLTSQSRLRAQSLFNAALIDNSPLPICVTDRNNLYLRVNRAWEGFAGQGRDALLGRQADVLLADEAADLHRAHDRDLLTLGGQQRYEAQHRNPQGQLRDLFITKSALPGEDGPPAGVITVIMDFTDFREAERQTRRAKEAAEHISESKSEFIANISHELRTPLQSILGFSELGLRRAQEHPRFVGMFQSVHDAGQRMLHLVNDLLDLSKLQGATGGLQLYRHDVRPLLQAVVHELYPQLRARQLRLQLTLAPTEMVAMVDPQRFSQVIRNVLANAIRFSPEAGLIEVQGRISNSGWLEVVLADQGPGVPPDELEAIFEAFVQSSKTKDGSGGTGLGLAISRTIMRGHDGDIVAENRVEPGTLFRISLPGARFGDTTPAAL
jgi:PAS domain S-box-containing protein